MTKSLDTKLARILSDPSCGDFILADAKDADMAFGVAAPGRHPDGRARTLEEFHDIIVDNVEQGLLDIMLMSPSTNEQLTMRRRIFDRSHITPAARANDTTDIHLAAGSVYASRASRPFRSAAIEHLMYGTLHPKPGAPVAGADLGLYSVTFNNDLERDLESLEAYRAFRLEAESKGFRHFLEVFNPNACGQNCLAPEGLGRYINDMIVRTLAGVVSAARPLFLKIAYNGPEAMEQLASYDRSLVVGILGGASGTTFDAFHQLAEARRYGARVALYGRMINNSEHQRTMIQHLRWIADGELDDPAQAVRSYHGELQNLGIPPLRPLEDDLKLTDRGLAYSAGRNRASVNPGRARPSGKGDDKIAQNLERWDRILG